MEVLSKTIEVAMTENLKDLVTTRCRELNLNYSEYIRMLIILDINSCKLKDIQFRENNLLESIDNIRSKLENY